jgi:hypothetical protein
MDKIATETRAMPEIAAIQASRVVAMEPNA